MYLFFTHLNKFLIIFSFFILTNCQLQDPTKTHGILFLENRSKKLVINNSNQNDVVRIMGQPQIKETGDNTWIYIERVLTKGKFHKLGQNVLKENNVLVLKFDKYGVLNNQMFLDKTEMNEIAFSKNKTDNQLSQRSFVESFLQSIKQKMYRQRK